MASGIFFLSWALWQQMTFALALGIIVVFCAGLVKLWWNNRLMKKQEILDEEKRARTEEMRRTGLPLKRTNEIPFGVRAIQNGVEVDGIWISRPTSQHETTATEQAASVTIVNIDPEKMISGEKTILVSTVNLEPAPPKNSPPSGSIFQRLSDTGVVDGGGLSPDPPISKFMSKAKRKSHRGTGVLNEDTLRRLEGQSQQNQAYDTYMPTSAPRNPRQTSQRSSASSSGESMESQPRSTRTASGRSYTSSRSSRLYMARNIHENRTGYSTVPHEWAEKEHRDPFETPARTPSGFSALSQTASENHAVQPQNPELLSPEPTFGPGDLHINRSTRRVNAGFEVLPAGTFGVLHDFDISGSASNADKDEISGHKNRPQLANKLRKKSTGQLQEEVQTYGQTQ
ncbi:hypothetical protein B0T25DRAFT_23052 [Lasiosphaeria hispida]|uniref:Uncharacterized protein n=1 Tax=Lasiosphaeria hispida TaxID=260671 RepID=A0AAJ0HU28_9PEZI|nr:hypothetical protein B0T25DRAFT_23052 [Lasiosphaeria hispida]